MDTLSTKDLLQKAAMVSGDLNAGGMLNPQQANRFIDILIEQSVLMAEARVERMNAPKAKLESLGFASRLLGPATEATDPGVEHKPDTALVNLDTVESIGVVPISYSVFEDNLERAALAEHITRLIAERAGIDLEDLMVNGDTGSGDTFLASNDGLLKMATSHVADAQTLADATDVLAALDAAYKLLPKKFIAGRNKREWRFYLHSDAEFGLRQMLSERATGAGDRYLLEDAPVLVRGIPVVALPVVPTITDVDSGTAGNQAGSDALLMHPKNAVIGIQRAISVESDRRIRERVIDYVVTVRSDVEFENEDAVVKVTGIEHS